MNYWVNIDGQNLKFDLFKITSATKSLKVKEPEYILRWVQVQTVLSFLCVSVSVR